MMPARCLVGLIGANIMKSLSPALHEDAFAAAGIIGHYHLMDFDQLPGRRLDQLLAAVRQAGFAGVNVTFPVKQAILPLLDEVSADARQIGAVNTVKITESGTIGFNTDRSGFRRSCEEGLGRASVEGRAVALIGAGGAGRAVAFAVMDLGAATVIVHDTNAQQAASLVADVRSHFGATRCSVGSSSAGSMNDVAGVVNATPVGMLGNSNVPLPLTALRAEHWVADVIYTPMETRLIEAARAKGCRVLTGGGMCVHQAADAFRHFTGLEPDVDRMHRTFAQALATRDRGLASTI